MRVHANLPHCNVTTLKIRRRKLQKIEKNNKNKTGTKIMAKPCKNQITLQKKNNKNCKNKCKFAKKWKNCNNYSKKKKQKIQRNCSRIEKTLKKARKSCPKKITK